MTANILYDFSMAASGYAVQWEHVM